MWASGVGFRKSVEMGGFKGWDRLQSPRHVNAMRFHLNPHWIMINKLCSGNFLTCEVWMWISSTKRQGQTALQVKIIQCGRCHWLVYQGPELAGLAIQGVRTPSLCAVLISSYSNAFYIPSTDAPTSISRDRWYAWEMKTRCTFPRVVALFVDVDRTRVRMHLTDFYYDLLPGFAILRPVLQDLQSLTWEHGSMVWAKMMDRY